MGLMGVGSKHSCAVGEAMGSSRALFSALLSLSRETWH